MEEIVYARRKNFQFERLVIVATTRTHLCLRNEIGALFVVRRENFETNFELV
jgi:hypothetical protein